MELQELDCPFCENIGNWAVTGVEFVNSEVYLQSTCPKCKKSVVISIPLIFNQMRMFVTPKRRQDVRPQMLAPDRLEKNEITKTENKE